MDKKELLRLIDQAAEEGWTKLDLSYKGIIDWLTESRQLSSLRDFLNSDGLSELPDEIGQLINLQVLYLNSNQLTWLPTTIGQLSNLTRLGLSGNQFVELPKVISELSSLEILDLNGNKLELIPSEISRLFNLKILLLNNNHFTSIPLGIYSLTNLKTLALHYNQITALPSEINHLTSLNRLYLRLNKLTTLPAEIGLLKNLSELYLDTNHITDLPPEIGYLTNLTALDLLNNQLSKLPLELTGLTKLTYLNLRGNPLPIPPEILRQTGEPKVILSYYFQQRTTTTNPLHEAKVLLVGQGGVGKTSLVKRLIHDVFESNEGKTAGIDIHRWQVPVDDHEVRLNVWDFGGQEIYHATHQFFLTKRSLYLLVLNAREGEQQGRLEYWLKLIESFGGDAPIIVVVNKIDEHPLKLDERGLMLKYPTIRAFAYTSCKTGQGIPELRETIQQTIAVLPHVNDRLPVAWFNVKERLQEMKKDVISYERYEELCQEAGIEKADEQRILLRLLHDLGTVLNFQDDRRLEDTNVLNPNWVTQGVYRLLTAESFKERGGTLHLNNLDGLLDTAVYPSHKHHFLVEMMRKFELCFPFTDGSGRYLVPDLLPKEEPDLGWPFHHSLAFELHYNVLPGSILTRLMVRKYRLIDSHTYWRNGVALAHEGAQALVKADREDKKLFIWVTGTPANARRNLLSIIRAELADIHGSFAALQTEEVVPIPAYPGHTITYEELRNLEEEGIEVYYYARVKGKIHVRQLLDGIETPEERDLVRLWQDLKARFNDGDLRNLAFELGLDHEELPLKRSEMARELVLALKRQGRLHDLTTYLQEN